MSTMVRKSKPYKIKAPPQLDLHFAMLTSYVIELRTAMTVDPARFKELHIDLSAVEEADLLGVCAFFMGIARTMRDLANFSYKILPPRKQEVSTFLRRINIQRLLNVLELTRAERDLFTDGTLDANHSQDSIFPSSSQGTSGIGVGTIVLLPRVTTSARDEHLKLAVNVLREFYLHVGIEPVYSMRITSVFREIIRNTFDHSGQPGVLALQYEPDRSGRMQISFLACDLGNGITSNVREYFYSSAVPKTRVRAPKNAFGDFIHWAFRPGNTTKPTGGRNAGLGLPTIKAASRGTGLRIYLLDARGLVHVNEFADEYTHSKIRRQIHRIQGKPCFMYFGQTIDLRSYEKHK